MNHLLILALCRFQEVLPINVIRFRPLLLILGLLSSVSSYCQFDHEWYHIITSKGTSKHFTLKDGRHQNYNNLILDKKKYADFQVFRIRKAGYNEEPGYYILSTFQEHISNYVTIDTRQANSTEPSSANTNWGSKVVIHKPFVYDPKASYQLGMNYTHQRWKFDQIPGTKDTYWISSKALGGEWVMARTSTQDRSPIRLKRKNSSDISQQWVIKKVEITSGHPKNLRLKEFKFQKTTGKGGILSGYLLWEDHSKMEDGFQVMMSKPGESSNYIQIGKASKNGKRYDFELAAQLRGNNRYSFYVTAYNKWSSLETIKHVNAQPRIVSTPPTPPQTGVRKIVMYNCHNQGKRIKLYSFDLTTNSGWKYLGEMYSEKNTSGGCDRKRPKTITLTDGHTYIIKGLQCGSNPETASGECHRFTTLPILGDADGIQSVTYDIW